MNETVEGPEEILRKWAEAINRRDLAAARCFLHPQYRDDLFNNRESVADYPWWGGTRAASLWPLLDLSRITTEYPNLDGKQFRAGGMITSLGNPHVASVTASAELRRTEAGWRVFDYRLDDLHLPDLDADASSWRRITTARSNGAPAVPLPSPRQKVLADEEVVVTVAPHRGVPTLHVNGKPDSAQMMMCFEPKSGYYRFFGEQGVQWVSCDSTVTAHDWRVAKTVWIAEDEFDFTELDDRMNLLVRENPDALLLPMIFFGTPEWWARKHPDHVMQYETAEGNLFPVRLFGRKVASWASSLWRDGCLKALDRYLEHVAEQPYGKRIGGYHLTSGSGGEEWFQYWGPEGEFTDYSKTNRACFRDWVARKYRTDEKLRKALDNPTLRLAEVDIPRTSRRKEKGKNSFHHPVSDRDILDLMEYVGDITAETLALFATRVKERTGGTKLCGAFFGYINSIVSEPREHDSGHLGLPRILSCKAIDFLSSPSAYTHRRPGIGHRKTMGATESVKLHGKLWWNQMDDRSCIAAAMVATGEEAKKPFHERLEARRRTRLATVNGYHGVSDTLEETLQAQWSVFAMSLVSGIGHYWFDMQGGWYDEAQLMETIGTMKAIADKSLCFDRSPIHDIAFIVSSDSRRFSKQGSHLSVHLIEAQQYYLGKLGAPYNFYLLEDIESIPPHKLWIFANPFHVPDHLREAIERKTRGSDVLWFHGAGFVTADGHSLESSSRLVGMGLGVLAAGFPQLNIVENVHSATLGVEGLTYGQAEFLLSPLLYVDDPEVTVLGRLTDSFYPGLAVKQTEHGRRYFSSCIYMPPALLRNIARTAGVHLYAETNETVLANESFLAISNTDPGRKTVRLRRTTPVVDVIKDEVVSPATDRLELEFGPKETQIFFLGPPEAWETSTMAR